MKSYGPSTSALQTLTIKLMSVCHNIGLETFAQSIALNECKEYCGAINTNG